MLNRCIAALFISFFSTCPPAWASPELDGALKGAVRGTRVPAMGAAILRGGEMVDVGVVGVRRNDRKARVDLSDVWLIGSTGKVMTVAMVARLVERGVLSWDTSLQTMLPALAETMRPEYRNVTLLELLSHRAGLPRDVGNRAFFDSFYTDTRPLNQQRLAYVREALTEAAVKTPATEFSYSNSGFMIAAVIAEAATGQTYEALMAQEVFGPLGMASAGFGNTHEGQTQGHHSGKPKTRFKSFDDGGSAMFSPAGFLHMSLRDWAQFNLDQLAGSQGKGKLLQQGSYHLMQTAQPGSIAGLDWGVQDSIAGRKGPVLVHAGSDGNWLAYAILFPEQGTGVLAVANASQEMGADQAMMGLLGKIFPKLSPAK